jgi:hypothetical protein
MVEMILKSMLKFKLDIIHGSRLQMNKKEIIFLNIEENLI